MANPFASAYALLERASAHLDELNCKIGQFQARRPYRIISSAHPLIPKRSFLKARVDELPPQIPCIVFDAVNCLRSALDHAVYESTLVLSGEKNPNSTKFPFGDDLDLVRKEFKRGASGVPEALREFLIEFEVRRDGKNQSVWALNKVRNGVIHRILTPMAQNIAQSSLAVGAQGASGGVEFLAGMNDWNEVTRELTYAEIEGAHGAVAVHVEIAPSFTMGSHFPAKPVVRTLREVSGIVEGIVRGIEAETDRLAGGRNLNG